MPTSRHVPTLCAAGLALALVAFGIAHLDEFGPTWDTAIGEYPHGEQYLAWLTSGDDRFLDFSPAGARPVHREPHPDFAHQLYPWYGSHPFGAILSAASCRLVWTDLGLLDAMSAHNVPILLLGALLAFVLVRFGAARFGTWTGVAAGALLLLQPRVLPELLTNLKDVPEVCLYALAVLAFWRAHERPTAGRVALGSILLGLALAQKPNAFFVPVQVALAVMLDRALRVRSGEAMPPRPRWTALLALLLVPAAYLAVSPMLWADPAGRFVEQFRYLAWLGVTPMAPVFNGLAAVALTTPPAVLLLAALGLASQRIRGRDKAWLALGLVVPIGRTQLPGFVNYDGVRHFLEFEPFLALLAGIGLADVAALVARKLAAPPPLRIAAAALAVAVLLADPLLATARTWPYGTCYFNAFAGGFGGAQRRGIADATDYWAAGYWEALARISAVAPPGSAVAAPVAPWVVAAAAPMRLRSDVTLLDPDAAGAPSELFVLATTRRMVATPLLDWLEKAVAPWDEVRVQGGIVCRIWRLRTAIAVARALGILRDERASGTRLQRLMRWFMRLPPSEQDALQHAMRSDDATFGELVDRMIPTELRDDYEAVRGALRDAVRRAPQGG